MTPTPQPQEAVIPSEGAAIVALRELYAIVKGECPSLLNEDSGGNGMLDMEISDILAAKPSTREAEAPVSVEEMLRDPHAVHINMLRGSIAKLSPAQIGHLYRGDEAKAVIAEVARQNPGAAPVSEAVWKPIDADTPTDRMIIAMCRYPEATAGSPSFVLWDGEFGWEFSRRAPDKMVCWAWMERDVLGAWPSEPSPTTVNNKGET